MVDNSSECLCGVDQFAECADVVADVTVRDLGDQHDGDPRGRAPPQSLIERLEDELDERRRPENRLHVLLVLGHREIDGRSRSKGPRC